MKKNIKKYNQFLIEGSSDKTVVRQKLSTSNLNDYLKRVGDFKLDINSLTVSNMKSVISDDVISVIMHFLELRGFFYDTVIDMVEFFPGYFSDMCKRVDSNPEEDFNEMQSLMNKRGFTIESIQNLFSDRVNNLCGYDFEDFFKSRTKKLGVLIERIKLWFSDRNMARSHEQVCNTIQLYTRGKLTMTNGHCDVYLYFISKKLGYEKLVEFGGEGWCEYTTDSEEIVIRYSYGYHHTKYGQMMLEFVGMTKEQFIEMSLTSLKYEIIKNWERDSLWGGEFNTDLSNALSKIGLDSYFLVDIDRLIISVSEITKKINSITGENYTIDDIISMIGAHHSSGDTVFTGEDLIIYAE
jgi:hypothetical protein